MKKLLLILFVIPILSLKLTPQSEVAKAQAMFIYNFSRHADWPIDYKNGNFVIGVFGSPDLFAELQKFTRGKKVGSQNIEVKLFNSENSITKCHMLFVAFGSTKRLPAILPKLAGKSTLIITEKNGAISSGAALNFLLLGSKLKYEISPSNASKYKVKLSSQLQQMAYKVY